MRDRIKEALRFAVTQFFIITVCVMFVIALANTLLVQGFHYPIDGTFPWVMMLTGLLGSLPSFLLHFREEPTKKQFYLRMLLHYIVLNAVILGEGRLLGWYTTLQGMLIIAGTILAVYGLVWLFSTIAEANTAQHINQALEEFNGDENEE